MKAFSNPCSFKMGSLAGAVFLIAIAPCRVAQGAASQISCEQETIVIALDVLQVHKHWKVRKNEACIGRVEVKIKKNNGVYSDGFIDNFVVLRKAIHGTAGVMNSRSDGGFAYSPQPDFTGGDNFAIGLDHHLNDDAGNQKVSIMVDVDVSD